MSPHALTKAKVDPALADPGASVGKAVSGLTPTNLATGAAEAAVSSVTSGLGQSLVRGALYVVFVIAGLALIVVGLLRMFGKSPSDAGAGAAKAAAVAA